MRVDGLNAGGPCGGHCHGRHDVDVALHHVPCVRDVQCGMHLRPQAHPWRLERIRYGGACLQEEGACASLVGSARRREQQAQDITGHTRVVMPMSAATCDCST